MPGQENSNNIDSCEIESCYRELTLLLGFDVLQSFVSATVDRYFG